MANLRGGSVQKQLKDAFHRLTAFKTGRHGKDDHLTHSDGTAKIREKLLRDIGDFIDKEGITTKVNLALTPENMDKLLSERLKGLANNSKESYIRSFSSLIQGLNEKNITTEVKRDYFDQKMRSLRSQKNWKAEVKTDQAIKNPEVIIQKLYAKRYETGVYTQVMHELGLRAQESIRLLNDPSKYIVERDGGLFVENLKGKNNHIYNSKKISSDLVYKIEKIHKMPSYSTLYRDLKFFGIKAHGFRFGYSKERLNQKLEAAKDYRTSLKEVSKSLNHYREDVTSYYIRRA